MSEKYDCVKNDTSLEKEYSLDLSDINNEIFTIDELSKKVCAELEIGRDASFIVASNILTTYRITRTVGEVWELISDFEENISNKYKIKL